MTESSEIHDLLILEAQKNTKIPKSMACLETQDEARIDHHFGGPEQKQNWGKIWKHPMIIP
jgi:hypothetical protein